MDLAEALLALGVGGAGEWETLSAEALKRAYLKKVRAHPPERDPQGFQRVREAYDLLRALDPVRTAICDLAPLTSDAATRAEEPETARAPETDDSAFARLQQAADALLEIYRSAPLARPSVAPQLVLSTIAKQFMGDSPARGRRLLLAFEEDRARMNDPLSERVAALWKLLTELVAIPPQVPPAVIRALARGIDSGNFQDATEALREEIDERGKQRQVELECALQAAAPTLHGAAWPRTPGASRKQRSNEEGWAVYMLLTMVVIVAGYSLTFVESGPHRRMRELQLAAANASSRASDRDSAPDATIDEAKLGALGLEQSKELEAATLKLEKVLRFSRCEQLHSVWKEYTSVVQRLKGYESVMEQYLEHRSDAMTTCRVLPSQLTELP
jgi:curved DNA-binding protein CbpA